MTEAVAMAVERVAMMEVPTEAATVVLRGLAVKEKEARAEEMAASKGAAVRADSVTVADAAGVVARAELAAVGAAPVEVAMATEGEVDATEGEVEATAALRAEAAVVEAAEAEAEAPAQAVAEATVGRKCSQHSRSSCMPTRHRWYRCHTTPCITSVAAMAERAAEARAAGEA